MTKAKPIDELDDTMRVLTTGTCDTLSGSSRLIYHIGSMPDGEIYLRVHSNTGGGFFSQEWISLRDILTALKKRPDGKPITSILLVSLFRGKSANTPGFMMAVQLHEKVIRSMQGKLRRHELMDTSAFKAKVDKLLSGAEGKAKPAKTAGKPAGKAPAKKAASPSKRKNATPRFGDMI
jgi:hypothetical protein